MGKGKLEKFAQLDAMPHVVQPSKEEILGTFRLRGQWKSDFFKSDRPLVVELGCGRGEYTVALAALTHSAQQLQAYVRDTERLAPEARRSATDQPEMWQAKLAAAEALRERLLAIRPFTPTESPR